MKVEREERGRGREGEERGEGERRGKRKAEGQGEGEERRGKTGVVSCVHVPTVCQDVSVEVRVQPSGGNPAF